MAIVRNTRSVCLRFDEMNVEFQIQMVRFNSPYGLTEEEIKIVEESGKQV